MKVKRVSLGMIPDLYELFRSAQISLGEAMPGRSGFVDYPLSYGVFEARAKGRFSLVLLDGNKINAYLIAYGVDELPGEDPVFPHLPPGRNAYLDQLFLSGKHLPTMGILMDTSDYHLRQEGIERVFTAIPQAPWRNSPSTRLAHTRGFSRIGQVPSGDVRLGLFSKPYIDVSY